MVVCQSHVTPPSSTGIIFYGQNDFIGGRIKAVSLGLSETTTTLTHFEIKRELGLKG
jgi:hypothetical protein